MVLMARQSLEVLNDGVPLASPTLKIAFRRSCSPEWGEQAFDAFRVNQSTWRNSAPVKRSIGHGKDREPEAESKFGAGISSRLADDDSSEHARPT